MDEVLEAGADQASGGTADAVEGEGLDKVKCSLSEEKC